MPASLDLNKLAIFHAVAEHGSVTRAAGQLLISQPAVSKQLISLERTVGTPLFDRVGRGLQPTRAGKLLAGYCRQIFALVNRAESALLELRGLARGELSIGASTTAGVYLLPDAVVAFRRRFPEISVRMNLAGSDSLKEALLAGTIDMAITEGQIDHEQLERCLLLEDEMIAVAQPGHPLVRRRHVSAEELCREEMVVREARVGVKSFIERVLAERGLSARRAMSLGSTEAVKHAVAAGVGIAIVARMAVQSELKLRQLAQIKVRDLTIRRPIWVVRSTARSGSAAANAFMEMIQKRTA